MLGDGLADAYEVVVLKRGREGVRVLRRGADAVDVPAATAAAVDQTGAGDAFAAGYLAALVQRRGRRGLRAGGGARRDRGGQPPRRAAAVARVAPPCSAALRDPASRERSGGRAPRRDAGAASSPLDHPPLPGDWPRGAADPERQAGRLRLEQRPAGCRRRRRGPGRRGRR